MFAFGRMPLPTRASFGPLQKIAPEDEPEPDKIRHWEPYLAAFLRFMNLSISSVKHLAPSRSTERGSVRETETDKERKREEERETAIKVSG